ncbi:MAG: [acyl-carrier-protein] S-malonyltransferase [Actinomycetota bacterium]|jgi:[acyl-carrier-protein] S-malonyltransferase
MGLELRDLPAWHLVTDAEEILATSLAPLLLGDELKTTQAAQMAVLLHSLVCWETVKDEITDVASFAGHSLGQITALIASGSLSFETGVQLAAHRAAVTQESADHKPGVMAALLGASDEQVAAAVANTSDSCWVANLNAPGQTVIAGTPEGLAVATDAAKAAGVRKVVPLDVAAAFHTPLMQEAADAFNEYLLSVEFGTPSAPIVSNEDGAAYTDGNGWQIRLVSHLVKPVRWADSMITIDTLGPTTLREVGPGTTLTALAKRCLPDSEWIKS